jgi:hypothetical protein
VDQHAQAFAGFKSYIRALGKTQAELLAMAADLANGVEDVTITSISGDGTASSGQIGMLPRELRLSAVMEVINEGPNGRQLFDIADRSRYGTMI